MAQDTMVDASTQTQSQTQESANGFRAGNNREFLEDTFQKLKFGKAFNELLGQKLAEGLPEFELKGRIIFNPQTKETMEIAIRLQEQSPQFYVMKGYMGTRSGENIETRSQFFDVFKKKGFDLNQARQLLRGGSVLNTVTKNGVTRTRYTKLDFKSNKTEAGNFKQIHTYDIGDLDVVKLLGKVRVMNDQGEKDEMGKKLKNGELVPIATRQGQMFLELDPIEKALNMYNSAGLVRQFTLDNNRIQVINDVPEVKGDLAGAGKDGEIVPGVKVETGGPGASKELTPGAKIETGSPDAGKELTSGAKAETASPDKRNDLVPGAKVETGSSDKSKELIPGVGVDPVSPDKGKELAPGGKEAVQLSETTKGLVIKGKEPKESTGKAIKRTNS